MSKNFAKISKNTPLSQSKFCISSNDKYDVKVKSSNQNAVSLSTSEGKPLHSQMKPVANAAGYFLFPISLPFCQ